MVGSKDYYNSQFGNFNVATSLRNPGSSIKVITYATAFKQGFSPATTVLDIPAKFPDGDKPYIPVNYDGKFHGTVQTRFALGNSLNIPAVKILAVNKLDAFIATASAMGLKTLTDDPNRYGYSLTLGGGETTMADLATAFGVFANAGRKQDLVSILKVESGDGKVLEDYSQDLQTEDLKRKVQKPWDGSEPYVPYDSWVLPTEVTFLISHILLDDSSRTMTFGAGSVLNIPGKVVSVKTGTTEDKRDNWTVGYTPSRLAAVWVGNNDNSAMSPYLESGNTGAAPIWNKIMKYALKDTPPEWPQKPENVVFLEVCALSGLLPDHGCPTRGEYFIKNFTPRDKDNVWDQKRKVWVFKDTHKQATGNFQPDQVQEEDHLVISDPLQKDFCADCPQ